MKKTGKEAAANGKVYKTNDELPYKRITKEEAEKLKAKPTKKTPVPTK